MNNNKFSVRRSRKEVHDMVYDSIPKLIMFCVSVYLLLMIIGLFISAAK